MRMKHLCAALIAASLLTLGPAALQAQTTTSPQADLTGKNWLAGEKEGKLAFLYGASNVIAIEMIGAEKTGRPAPLFAQGWTEAFRNTTYPQLLEQIDAWYEANPDQLNRNVFDVIWNELIVPARTGKKPVSAKAGKK